MKLLIADLLAARFAPELTEWHIQLTPQEVQTLQAALAICERAGELIHDKEGEEENDWAWAEINLRYCLREGQ